MMADHLPARTALRRTPFSLINFYTPAFNL
jgi:hypothetical protein